MNSQRFLSYIEKKGFSPPFGNGLEGHLKRHVEEGVKCILEGDMPDSVYFLATVGRGERYYSLPDVFDMVPESFVVDKLIARSLAGDSLAFLWDACVSGSAESSDFDAVSSVFSRISDFVAFDEWKDDAEIRLRTETYFSSAEMARFEGSAIGNDMGKKPEADMFTKFFGLVQSFFGEIFASRLRKEIFETCGTFFLRNVIPENPSGTIRKISTGASKAFPAWRAFFISSLVDAEMDFLASAVPDPAGLDGAFEKKEEESLLTSCLSYLAAADVSPKVFVEEIVGGRPERLFEAAGSVALWMKRYCREKYFAEWLKGVASEALESGEKTARDVESALCEGGVRAYPLASRFLEGCAALNPKRASKIVERWVKKGLLDDGFFFSPVGESASRHAGIRLMSLGVALPPSRNPSPVEAASRIILLESPEALGDVLDAPFDENAFRNVANILRALEASELRRLHTNPERTSALNKRLSRAFSAGLSSEPGLAAWRDAWFFCAYCESDANGDDTKKRREKSLETAKSMLSDDSWKGNFRALFGFGGAIDDAADDAETSEHARNPRLSLALHSISAAYARASNRKSGVKRPEGLMHGFLSSAFSEEELDVLMKEERSAPSEGRKVEETRLLRGLSALRDISRTPPDKVTKTSEPLGYVEHFAKKGFPVPGNGTELLRQLLVDDIPENAPRVELAKKNDAKFWVPDAEYMKRVPSDTFNRIQGHDLVSKMLLCINTQFPRSLLSDVVREALENFKTVVETGDHLQTRVEALTALVDVASDAHGLKGLEPSAWFSKIRVPEGEWRTGRGGVEISTRKKDAGKICDTREIVLSPDISEIPLWLPLIASGRYILDGDALLSEVDISDARAIGRTIMTQTCPEPDFSSPKPLFGDDENHVTLLEVFAAWHGRSKTRTGAASAVLERGFSLDGLVPLIERRAEEGSLERMTEVAEFLSEVFFSGGTPKVREGAEVISSICKDPLFGEASSAFVQSLLEKMEQRTDMYSKSFRDEFREDMDVMEESCAEAKRAFLEATERLDDEEAPPPL